MAIAYFPQIYEDELFYSVIARYAEHYGGYSFKDAAKSIFINPKRRVEKEFLGNMKLDVLKLAAGERGIDDLILQHTMFPYYSCFFDKNRKWSTIGEIKQQDCDCTKLLGIWQNKTNKKRYLRLCPVCVSEDREKHGEAYWHRGHIMWNVTICPKHHAKLIESDIVLDASGTSVAVSAEYVASTMDIAKIEYETDARIHSYAKINTELMNKSGVCDMSDILMHLSNSMIEKGYTSKRGHYKYHAKLYEEMQKYYSGTYIMSDISPNSIQNTLKGKRSVPHEVAALMEFWNITVEDISKKANKNTFEYEFDEKVKQLILEGKSNAQIAVIMGCCKSEIRYIRNEVFVLKEKKDTYNKNCSSGIDWHKVDVEWFNKVKLTVDNILAEEMNRPKALSLYAVRKELGLSQHWIESMPSCRTYIEEKMVHNKTLDARATAWAIKRLKENGQEIRVWRIATVIKIGVERITQAIEDYPTYFNDDYDDLMQEVEGYREQEEIL